MKVIKVVYERDGKLVSTFAPGKWRKEYELGVETKPNTGYLFAYSSRNMKEARRNFGSRDAQYWLAEAKVVGKVRDEEITVSEERWCDFWGSIEMRLRRRAEYLLCSSITLIKELKV